MNINFPDIEPDARCKVRITGQGKRDARILCLEERIDPRNNSYYWYDFKRESINAGKGQTLKRFWKAIFPSRRSKWIIRIPEPRRSCRRCLANGRANALAMGLALGVAACAPVSTDSWYDSERNARAQVFLKRAAKIKTYGPCRQSC